MTGILRFFFLFCPHTHSQPSLHNHHLCQYGPRYTTTQHHLASIEAHFVHFESNYGFSSPRGILIPRFAQIVMYAALPLRAARRRQGATAAELLNKKRFFFFAPQLLGHFSCDKQVLNRPIPIICAYSKLNLKSRTFAFFSLLLRRKMVRFCDANSNLLLISQLITVHLCNLHS